MFGDVIKVTPTSKTVGDMALAMVTRDLTPAQVLDPDVEIAFSASVISFFRGEIGQPPGGFPEALQKKLLGDEPPLTVRPGAVLAPVDLAAARADAEKAVHRQIHERELASWLGVHRLRKGAPPVRRCLGAAEPGLFLRHGAW
jgi:pyruvate carboxylase